MFVQDNVQFGNLASCFVCFPGYYGVGIALCRNLVFHFEFAVAKVVGNRCYFLFVSLVVLSSRVAVFVEPWGFVLCIRDRFTVIGA